MTAPLLPSGRRPNTPAGLYYDGETKDTPLDSYGQIKSVHWVDEQMGMSLCSRKGDIKACPEVGNDLRKIQYLGGEKLGDEVQAMVLAAYPLSKLVAAGQVSIVDIEHWTEKSSLAVRVRYINHLTADARNLTSHERTLEWYSNG